MADFSNAVIPPPATSPAGGSSPVLAAAQGPDPQLSGGPGPAAVDPQFLSWAREHQRQNRRHGAELAQITRHPDPGEGRSALAQQRAWARRQSHERHLHDSAMAQLRHR